MSENAKKAVSNEILQQLITNVHSELDKKYSKVTEYTKDHLVAFDENGNLVDSGGTGGTGDTNKIDVIQDATPGNLPIITATGMLTDSTKSISDIVTKDIFMTDADIDAMIEDLFPEDTEEGE